MEKYLCGMDNYCNLYVMYGKMINICYMTYEWRIFMKTDIEIAQETVMEPIQNVAAQLDISADDLEFYGKYKAKLTDELWDCVKDKPDGKLILVTAINPTPAGEGKTTTTVGLGQAFAKLGKKAVIALREPSDSWARKLSLL